MKVLLLIIFLLPCQLYGQSQEGTVFFYNVALGGITSGIRADINKPKALNWKRAFVLGVWQGSIGHPNWSWNRHVLIHCHHPQGRVRKYLRMKTPLFRDIM